MKKLTKEELLKKVNGWVYEASWAAREWRAESWRDAEMFDGGDAQWTQEDWNRAEDAGIDPITINRTFPVCNMLLGSQAINRFDTVAKGRSNDDSEIGQVMTEGIKFIMDQWDGEFVVSEAFKDSVIPGFGCVYPGLNQDPRYEKLCIKQRDWKEIWWDPFSSPWWNPYKTRYVYWQRWTDLDEFQALFPEKSKEIQNAYDDLSGSWKESGYTPLIDEAQEREEKIRTLSASDWVDTHRKRIRPVEMWYPVNQLCLFALYPDGRCFEIKDGMDPRAAYQAISNSQEILRAIVKKMRICTFFGEDLLLQDQPTPFGHDQYPLIPFIGYIDRWGFPYGVPRQIRGQNEETNKRRSMALAMLQKRRVIAEKGVVHQGDRDLLDNLYEEANKLDGFMVIEDGRMQGFQIEELAQLSEYQMRLMNQSEIEIREIAGTNAPSLGYEQPDQSGVAKKHDAERSAITTATLFDNLRRSMKMLGDQCISNIQSFWKYEKVLRVTDRLTGAERFVTVNQVLDGGIEVKNNITQGKFDCVVSETPATDTVREKNMDLLYAAIEKSPPEAVPTLLIAAFEMSDLPNKEMLLEKLKPVLGIEPEDEDMDAEEKKRMVLEQLAAHKEREQLVADIEMEKLKTDLAEQKMKTAKLEAEIKKILAETEKTEVETEISAEQHEVDLEKEEVNAFDKGIDIAHKLQGGNGQSQQVAGNA